MMKNISTATEEYPTGICIVMHCDNIMNIRDTGIEVLD
jgi:hypothetical protein